MSPFSAAAGGTWRSGRSKVLAQHVIYTCPASSGAESEAKEFQSSFYFKLLHVAVSSWEGLDLVADITDISRDNLWGQQS